MPSASSIIRWTLTLALAGFFIYIGGERSEGANASARDTTPTASTRHDREHAHRVTLRRRACEDEEYAQ
jgi:hypothetical protein